MNSIQIAKMISISKSRLLRKKYAGKNMENRTEKSKTRKVTVGASNMQDGQKNRGVDVTDLLCRLPIATNIKLKSQKRYSRSM